MSRKFTFLGARASRPHVGLQFCLVAPRLSAVLTMPHVLWACRLANFWKRGRLPSIGSAGFPPYR